MYLRTRAGLGSTAALPTSTWFGIPTDPYPCQFTANWIANPACWGHSTGTWAQLAGTSGSGTVAPPPAPTGTALTLPPASGEDAAALVQSLADQQLRDQQALNATQVKSSWWDEAASGIVDTGNSFTAPGGLSWLVWGALGLGAFALVAVGGGSARRYGR